MIGKPGAEAGVQLIRPGGDAPRVEIDAEIHQLLLRGDLAIALAAHLVDDVKSLRVEGEELRADEHGFINEQFGPVEDVSLGCERAETLGSERVAEADVPP